MCLLPPDERGLRRALELAREAAAFASPNPTVGCVLLHGEHILGEGAHHYDAFDHAEIVALKQARAAGHDLSNATACVTLEPCAHHGRTGPCSDALIAAGISRCVVATIDPNPLVRGQGLAKLQAAGVDVLLLPPHSELSLEARRLNDAFAFSIQHHRPFVTLKAALSADGKLAPPASQRTPHTPHWLTGPAARADVQHLRHTSDALLTGIGTVLTDDPSLTDRTHLPRRPLLRVVLDSQLRMPLDSQLVRSAAEHRQSDLLIFSSEDAPEDRESELRAHNVEVHRLPPHEGRLDLRVALDVLNGHHHIRSVLVEGGSVLSGTLLRDKLVDKVVLYLAEQELGEAAVPFAEGISPHLLEQQLTSIQRTSFTADATEDTRITGYLHDPWTGI